MWLYLPWGFFSVIKHKGDFSFTVRARVAADLDRLRERYLPELGPTISTPNADYHFRAAATTEAFATAFAKIATDIDYPNVKAQTMAVSGLKRELVYARVHAATMDLERLDR